MGLANEHMAIGVEEYLEGERTSDVRHEYVNGTVYAMVGASRVHNAIAGNLFTLLHAHLRGGPCRVFMSDVKVHLHVGRDELFYYPDIVVTCEKDDRHPYYVEQPRLIAEVLSAGTERIDRREKLLAYTQLPSLEEYVLIGQERREAAVLRRAAGWEQEWCGVDGELALESVGLRLLLAELYAGIE